MSLLMTLLPALSFGAPVEAATIRDMQITENAITLAFDGMIEKASTFALVGPQRIAIDINGATPGTSGSSGGLVSASRLGQFNAQTARIVLDLARPAIVSAANYGKDGRTLTLNLKPVDQVRFASAAQAGRTSFLPPLAFRAAATSVSNNRNAVNVPLPKTSPYRKPALPKTFGPNDLSLPLVVIDAGHGGHDPGAISVLDSRQEKNATLAIARAVRDALVRSGQVRVALTRDSDTFLPLPERVDIARRMKANLFISIHADSAASPQARGASIYTLSDVASDKEAARLAAAENKADVISGVDLGRQSSDVQSILIDLAQRETMNMSSAFAMVLRRETASTVPYRTDFHQFANFRVLKAPDVPSVLMETGYLSNEDDARQLFSSDGQQRIGRGIASAIQAHFARRIALASR
ncbi:N-acetylmuramoyl-L-alanine amidase [Aquisediminimonas sediminicola]|uniref:N-acetylmuramoyl-L-alanine amidase n=1 Tax=Alteraquisediminimonas sediminicola TaxID=2676787 RepID=UPI001C8D0AAD|nr:N-acetylmuramoyl-L-alanine amidase [Aquisediminimonas sediminicola]